jgi:hypothetical protein
MIFPYLIFLNDLCIVAFHADLPRVNHGLFYFSIRISQHNWSLGREEEYCNNWSERLRAKWYLLIVAKIIGSCYNLFLNSSKYCYEYHIIDFFKRT